MQDQVNPTPTPHKRVPWNKGKLRKLAIVAHALLMPCIISTTARVNSRRSFISSSNSLE